MTRTTAAGARVTVRQDPRTGRWTWTSRPDGRVSAGHNFPSLADAIASAQLHRGHDVAITRHSEPKD